jgi:hypothetical protein
MSQAPVLYACEVMHRRYRPVEYRFVYRTFSLLIDIDDLQGLDRASPLLSVNRFNLLSLHAADHLPPGETDMRAWIDGVLASHGIESAGVRVRLLCMPRVLGWGFDPLSIWYCESPEGEPVATVCEVHNTFGERHCYLLRPSDARWPLNDSRTKVFHVSPFIPVSGRYAFALSRPGRRLHVAIQLKDGEGALMSATQSGQSRPFTTMGLLAQFVRVPFQTAKVLGGIHWHALKIWLRGVPFHRKPEPPREEIS